MELSRNQRFLPTVCLSPIKALNVKPANGIKAYDYLETIPRFPLRKIKARILRILVLIRIVSAIKEKDSRAFK